MWTLTSGYSLPSVHLIVSLVCAVDCVKNWKPATSSLNTTGRYSVGCKFVFIICMIVSVFVVFVKR